MDMTNHSRNSFNISMKSVGWEFSDGHLFVFGMLFTDCTDKSDFPDILKGVTCSFPKGLGKSHLEFTDKDCKIIMGN